MQTPTPEAIDKSRDRDELLTADGRRFDAELNGLAQTSETRQLPVTSCYGAPGVNLGTTGPNYEAANLIRTAEDVQKHFLSCSRFEPVGNPDFYDNGKKYLVWPEDPRHRYSFGTVFLRKVK